MKTKIKIKPIKKYSPKKKEKPRQEKSISEIAGYPTLDDPDVAAEYAEESHPGLD